MSAPAHPTAALIALRYLNAARRGDGHEEDIIAGRIDGIPVDLVETAVQALGLACHRERLKLHYRAPGEMPRLVLDAE